MSRSRRERATLIPTDRRKFPLQRTEPRGINLCEHLSHRTGDAILYRDLSLETRLTGMHSMSIINLIPWHSFTGSHIRTHHTATDFYRASTTPISPMASISTGWCASLARSVSKRMPFVVSARPSDLAL